MTRIEVDQVPVLCAPWSREQGVDPIGSAGRYDTVLLVAWPLPWPRDVGEIEELAPLDAPGTRVLLVVPEAHHPALTVWRRTDDGGFVGTDHHLSGPPRPELLPGLVDAPGPPAPADVLLCGHGQRDRCCGNLGVRLFLEVGDRWPGVRVRRCSHTGGHRYAPTGLTFPDGRMWAYLDAEVLDRIVAGEGDLAPVLDRYRGSLLHDPVVQVAERAAFGHLGWAWTGHHTTSAVVTADGDGHEVALTWTGPTGPGRAVARVGPGRSLPVPDCGSPIEAAKKVSREFVLRSFEVLDG